MTDGLRRPPSFGLPPHDHDPRLARLFAVRDLIEESPEVTIGLAHLARAAAMSRFHFLRLFRATFGRTPHQFAMGVRLERAKRLLATTDLSVTEICGAVGYESLGTFSTLFAREVGMTPRDYRARRRRFWTMGLEFPPLFIPACFLPRFRGGVEKQFPRRNRAEGSAIIGGELRPTSP